MATAKSPARARTVKLPEAAPAAIGSAPLPFDVEWLEIVRHAERRYRDDTDVERALQKTFNVLDLPGLDDDAPAEVKATRDAAESRWMLSVNDSDAAAGRLLDAFRIATHGEDRYSGIGTYGATRAFFAAGHLYILAGRDDDIGHARHSNDIVVAPGSAPIAHLMLFCIPLDHVFSLDAG